jgi:hypothetical protein
VWSSKVADDAAAVDWDGRDSDGVLVPPGIYVARLQAGEWQATAKVVAER